MRKMVSLLRCFVDRASTHGPVSHESDDVIAEIHQQLRVEKFLCLKSKSGHDHPVLPLQSVTQPFIWWSIAIADSCLQFFRPERDARRRIWQFFIDVPRMIYVALRYNLSPVHYYVYDFHLDPLEHDRIRRYLTGWEFHYLARRISRLRDSDVGKLDHKDSFETFCKEHDLPTFSTLDLSNTNVVKQLAPRDLFVKGTQMFGGDGCYLLRFQPDTRQWTVRDILVSADQMQTQLLALYEGAPFIVQYRARNHSEMLWLSDRVLTTIRVLTAWDPSGNPAVLRATIRIPKSPEAILDNSTQGGLAAPVNPHTGVISGPAIDWYVEEETDKPIGSERSFIGFGLPHWDDVVTTLKRAHSASGNYNFLGWDVAITEEGVVLNECNVWSDIELVQVPQKTPFLTNDVLACLKAESCLWNLVK